MKLVRARVQNVRQYEPFASGPRPLVRPAPMSPQPGSRAYPQNASAAHRPARAPVDPPDEGVPDAAPARARPARMPGGRPTSLPSAREAGGDHPLASLIQRLATDDGFRQTVRQEIQSYRQQRQRPGAQQRQGFRQQRRWSEEPQADADTTETSGMGEAWSDPFGEDPVPEADELAAQDDGAGELVFELVDDYGPLAQMSPYLRIQAARGYRAGVIQLRDGMFLVTEIPESALEPEFGVVAMLAPLAISVASKALEDPETQKALVHAAGKGIQATGKGVKAVGKGVKRLVHPGRRGPAKKPAPRRPPAQTAPAASREPMGQPNYVMAPQGYYYPPPGPPIAAYPGWQPMAAYPPDRFPAGRGYPRLPPAQAEPDALPWATPDDFQGLLEDSSWPAGW